jgi:hypothetical protein
MGVGGTPAHPATHHRNTHDMTKEQEEAWMQVLDLLQEIISTMHGIYDEDKWEEYNTRQKELRRIVLPSKEHWHWNPFVCEELRDENYIEENYIAPWSK